MNAFLNKISQLDSIRAVILLSHHGEPLFHNQRDPKRDPHRTINRWKIIIKELSQPSSADFLFEKGRFYLHRTAIGYLIIALDNDNNLSKVKSACTNVQIKLADSALCKKVLLKMLSGAEDAQKPPIIKELVLLADTEVARILISLLLKESSFQPKVRDTLILYICRTLGYCSSFDAIKPLKNISHTYDKTHKSPLKNAIKEAAQIAIAQLEQDRLINEKNGIKIATNNTIPCPVKIKDHTVGKTPEEHQVEELLKNGDENSAIAFIVQSIETAAHQKQFEKAENLREQLIKIAPMSLMEIIRAAEVIEEEKRADISNDHLAVWKDLVRLLSPEEYTSLYHAMTPKNYTNGEMIAKQGEFLSTLFFVNRGRVQLYAISQGKEVPLKTLGSGEIMGAETFFEVSVWTVNAKSMGAEVSRLQHKKLQDLKDTYPALESKLIDFCAHFQSSHSLFRKTKRTRRVFERKKISGRTTITLLNTKGEPTGAGAKGDLLDISKGGVSFCLHFSKKETATTYLGQAIRITIRTDISVPSFVSNGVVVAVRCHDFVGNEYSLHVKFDNQMASTKLQQIIMPTK